MELAVVLKVLYRAINKSYQSKELPARYTAGYQSALRDVAELMGIKPPCDPESYEPEPKIQPEEKS